MSFVQRIKSLPEGVSISFTRGPDKPGMGVKVEIDYPLKEDAAATRRIRSASCDPGAKYIGAALKALTEQMNEDEEVKT